MSIIKIKHTFILAILLSYTSCSLAQKSSKSHVEQIINFVLKEEKTYKFLGDSAIALPVESCFPILWQEIKLSKSDSLLILKQVNAYNNFKWSSKIKIDLPIVKVDSVTLLFNKQAEEIKKGNIPAKIYTRNFALLSYPVFFSNQNDYLIRKETASGAETLLLRKTKNKWAIIKKMCLVYY